MDSISLTLVLLIALLIIFGLIEKHFHLNALKKIPIRIHVNGTRGKSSVARLIAAGMRAGGLRTYAKTTGTTPRIINEKGSDVLIHRLRSASIGEQIKLIRYFSKKKPDVLIMECMAVNPQYQWVSEHGIVQSTLGVITNVRPDHLDEMGTTNKEIAYSLSNTIPFNSKIITAESENLKYLEEISNKRNSIIEKSDEKKIDKKYLDDFPYIEHPENIALALHVCRELGVSTKEALKGMLKTTPDPGALFIWNLRFESSKCRFISGFAANDPSSTYMVWKLITQRFNNKKCIFLNTRDDRRYRTIQLIELVLNSIQPDLFIIRADNVQNIIKNYDFDKKKIIAYDMASTPSDVASKIVQLDGYSILGIGNIVGWGENFIDKLKEYQ